MMDQYKESGPVPTKVEPTDSKNPIDSRVERLEATIHKHEGELSYLRREVSRLKSDINQVMNAINSMRRRG